MSLDFKNKKVTVMGLGLHGGGLGAAKFLCKKGANVLITDLQEEKYLRESIRKLKKFSVKYRLGEHQEQDFINTDLVIKNPAVPKNSKYLQIAQKNQVPVETETGIFFQICPAEIIGITGSKGKSTTASLVAGILEEEYGKVVLAGNIKISMLEMLEKIQKNTKVVLELSSWQLSGLEIHKKSPHIALITNILRDHLNYYQNINAYIEDKKQIFCWQTQDDYLILNYDDPKTRGFVDSAKGRVLYYSSKKRVDGAYLDGKDLLYKSEPKICSLEELALKGEHNLNNVLGAITVAKILGVKNYTIKKVLKKFKGIDGRMEEICREKGIVYINDTTATIPEATISALNSFDNKRVVLIAGGTDKKLDFKELAKTINKKVKALVLLRGTATNKLKDALASSQGEKPEISGDFNDMEKAVLEAKRLSAVGDIILLSPASASFGLFRHEFERGDKFKQAVYKLKEC